MTNKRSASRFRVMQLVFAGAATVGTLALFGAAQPVTAPAVSGSGSAGGRVITVDDTNPSSGDIFTQNAQDQSTA